MLEKASDAALLLSHRENGWLAVALTQEDRGFASLEISDGGDGEGQDGLMELLDGWMELNGIENFIRAAGALRDKVRSITIRNGCKGSSQGR